MRHERPGMGIRSWIWAGIGLVFLAYMLMALVKAFLPLLIVIGVIAGLYSVIFKRRW